MTTATYTTSTTAIVASEPQDGHVTWRMEHVRVRAPLPDEVQVRVVASGICHTDVAMAVVPPGAPGFAAYPKVLGHEGAGIVEKVGSSITHVKEGDKVLLSFDYCGREECKGCVDEAPGYCDEFHEKNLFSVPEVYALESDGTIAAGLFFGQSSFANVAICKGTSVLNVTDVVKSDEELKLFAPLGCGYQTGAGAVAELAKVGPQDAIAVFGLGGVGMAAIMAAKVRGAKTIIGVDRVSSRLDLARELGATHVIDTSNLPSLTTDLAAAIRVIVPHGTSANFDTTGVLPIISAGCQSLQRQGQMILIGIVSGTMDVDIGAMLNHGTVLRGCIEGNAKPSTFVPQMIAWYRQGNFPIHKLTTMYQSADFDTALQDMHAGNTIKAVLLW
ncbi:hypothetical protein ACN47E_004650 [Coniothyrium glycines]